MMEFSEVLHLDCDCISPEHTLRFSYEKEDEDWPVEQRLILVDVNLVNHRGFFGRLWWGMRYALGYKSRYGPYDEFVMNKTNALALKDFIEQWYSDTESSE